MTARDSMKRRGSPLAMLAVLMAVWVGGRSMVWEDPFALSVKEIIAEVPFLAAEETGAGPATLLAITPAVEDSDDGGFGVGRDISSRGIAVLGYAASTLAAVKPADALGQQMLWLQARAAKLPVSGLLGPKLYGLELPQKLAGVTPLAPSFQERAATDRWSVDAWAFWRQGSNSAPISQGRVPIYGASQAGLNLQYRIAPASRFDPRAYVRGYRALVSGEETELAAGASARPFASIPVRFSAEVRATENRFGQNIRPAVFATSELPPQNLPVGFRLEAYGGAGYVAGNGATAFADGQVAVTRELADVAGPSDARARISLGAGAWGGAQKNASRVDVGPTMRVDMTIGEVPARLSVDWREQVTGDAAPRSGIAATLSTSF